MSKLRLEILAIANYADFSKDGKLNIVGIFDEIYSDKVPGSFVRAFLALTVSGGEPNTQLSLTVSILSPSKTVVENEISLRTGLNGKGNFTVELVGLPLPESGTYTILVKSGGKTLGQTNFIVFIGSNGKGSRGGKPAN